MIQGNLKWLCGFCAAVATIAVFGGISEAAAQAYPNRVVKIISPWPAGGLADSLIRPIIEKLTVVLGQPVILDNRPGANGMVGTALVAKAPPDGYTLLLSHVGPMAISPNMKGFEGYDPVKDFMPISQLTSSSIVLVVRPELPIKTVKELIDYGKAHPSKLNMGSVGPGSTTHLAAEMMRLMGGLDYVHVPYKGNGPVVTDMLGGQIDYSFLGMDGVRSFIQAGKLRALAMTSLKRSTLVPELPTVSETLPGYEVVSWFAMHAPAGTPKPIVDRLSSEFQKIVQTPEMKEKLRQLTFEPEGGTAEQLAIREKEDLARWAKVVKVTGMAIN